MLERVLGSETFGRSERARDLLRYLIEREQAGEADRLKGFAVAMDVFGKDAAFDPSTDAVVRVQAGRLRDLLDQYYAGEGAADPWRIVIERGSYVPAYRASAPAPGKALNGATTAPTGLHHAGAGLAAAVAGPPPHGLDPQLARHVRMFWASMAVIVAMLGFLVVRMAWPSATIDEPVPIAAEASIATGSIKGREAVEALPVVRIALGSDDKDVARVAAILRAALTGFDTVDLVVRDPSRRGGEAPSALDFLFNVTAVPVAGRVAVEIQHAASGKVLISREFSPSVTPREALHDQVADMLSAAVPASGLIYGFIEQNQLQYGLTECLLLNDDYYQDQTPANHRAAYTCFEELGAAGAKSPLIYSELASLHLEASTDGYDYPPDASEKTALDLAYRGVLAGPTSPYAHRAYGFLVSRTGGAGDSIRWMRKAYQLNTYDLSMAAAYGYALIHSGDYAGGTPIIRRAVEASSSHPSWWDYELFLGAFMLDDTERAVRATRALAYGKRSHYLAARIIAANVTGDREQAGLLMRELAQAYPKFVENPRGSFEKAKYPPDLTEKLVAALRAAGLGDAS